MKPTRRPVVIGGTVILAVLAALVVARRTPSLHTEEAARIAVDAYVYGYPLVTFDMARRQQTNVAVPDGEGTCQRGRRALDRTDCAPLPAARPAAGARRQLPDHLAVGWVRAERRHR